MYFDSQHGWSSSYRCCCCVVGLAAGAERHLCAAWGAIPGQVWLVNTAQQETEHTYHHVPQQHKGQRLRRVIWGTGCGTVATIKSLWLKHWRWQKFFRGEGLDRFYKSKDINSSKQILMLSCIVESHEFCLFRFCVSDWFLGFEGGRGRRRVEGG